MAQTVSTAAATSAPPTERTNQRPNGVDDSRMPAREYYRSMARPDPAPTAHLKYHIDKADFVEGCDHVWVPIRVNGMNSGQLDQYLKNGWVPARACDFPKHSGYGEQYNDALRRKHYVSDVQADDPIEIDGEMLMLRAAELSQAAEVERIKQARNMVDVQMQRLEMASRASLGSKAADLMKVQYGKQYANPDTFDAEAGSRTV